MRKISVSGYGYIERLGYERSFELVGQAGFDAMDFPLYREKSRLELVSDSSGSFYSDLRKKAEESGLSIGQTHAPFGYREDDGSTFESILSIYERAATATAELGAKHMVVHPIKFENCVGGYRREECFELNLRLFEKLVPTLEECGVTALLENMFLTKINGEFKKLYPTIYSSAEELARAADALGPSFGVCLDSGHALITGTDIPDACRLLGERLLALHLHDNTGDRDDHLIPYFGKVPFEKMLDALKEIGYKGNINFEVHFGNVPEEHIKRVFSYIYEVGAAFRRRLDGGLL